MSSVPLKIQIHASQRVTKSLWVWITLGIILFPFSNARLFAQNTDENSFAEVDNNLFDSPRNKALSNSIFIRGKAPDIIMQNPAELGTSYFPVQTKHFVRELHFPRFHSSYNDLGQGFLTSRDHNEMSSDKVIADASQKSVENNASLFKRTGFSGGIMLGRLYLGANYDTQINTVIDPDDLDRVHLKYRTESSPVAGFAISDPRGSLNLGVSAAMVSRTEIEGSYLYSSFTDESSWSDFANNQETDSNAQVLNAGLTWRSMHASRVYVAFSSQYIGDSVFKNRNNDTISVEKERYNFSLGLNPRLSNFFAWNFAVSANQLLPNDMDFEKSYGIGTELAVFPRTPLSDYVRLRGGYSYQGASYGLGLDLGLIHVEFASYPVLQTLNAQEVTDKRTSIILGIDAADPFK